MDEAKTLQQLHKLKYKFYVQDYPITQCKPLANFLRPILALLQQLQSLGAWDLLLFLEETHNPFPEDQRPFGYVNCYLYYGLKGTGTPLHYVSEIL